MFPGEPWRRTQQSYDGKKDFVFPAEAHCAEQKWAECKNYKDNLSINVIAPTLVMAAIERIKHIIFFSYSQLNENALSNLTRYSKQMDTHIQILDGNVLEALICKYSHISEIAAFFPHADFHAAQKHLNAKGVRISKTLWDLNGRQLRADRTFEVGEPFCFSILLQNLSNHPITGEVALYLKAPGINDELLSNADISLQPYSVAEHSFQCQTLKAGAAEYTAKITLAPLKSNWSLKLPLKIADRPYLFFSGENALETMNQAQQHLKSRSHLPLLISGRSGMGKSTLLRILSEDKEILKSYTMLKLNFENGNYATDLFSQIIGVRGKDTLSKEQRADMDSTVSVLIDHYAQGAEETVKSLLRLYDKNRPYLFVLDDVQALHGTGLMFLMELNIQAQEAGLPIYFLFALDAEVLTPEEFFSRLNWDSAYQDKGALVLSLPEFEKKDILAYLATAYGLTNAEEYLKDLDKSMRPLDLRCFCDRIRGQGIIAPIPGKSEFQIVNASRFRTELQQALFFKISLKQLCNDIDQNAATGYILNYISVTGRGSQRVKAAFPKQLQKLIDCGILKQTDEDETVFFHSVLKKAAIDELVCTEQEYAEIFSDPDTDNTAKAICALKAIGRIRGGNEFLQQFLSTVRPIGSAESGYRLCQLIFKHLDQLKSAGLSTVALQFVREHFTMLREEYGYAALSPLLKQMATTAPENWDTDEQSVENMAFFIKKYFDRSLSNYDCQECPEKFEYYKELFTSLRYISEPRRRFWLCHYANRAAIAADRGTFPTQAEPKKVSELYDLSAQYSVGADAPEELSLQLTVDGFYRHYVYRQDLTVEQVRDTARQLREIDPKKVGEPMVCTYHLLLMELLRIQMERGNEKEAEALLENVRRVGSTCSHVFYRTKLYLLELIILFFLRRYGEAGSLLRQAIVYTYKKDMRNDDGILCHSLNFPS